MSVGRLTGVGLVVLSGRLSLAQPLVEHFDTVSGLVPAGWSLVNASEPVGTIGWFQGSPATFPPHASSGYIGANFQSVAVLGTISNWLVIPARTLSNGDMLQFWTRTVSPSVYADRLQVRMSTAGASVNVGSGATSVGDFATLLLDINPKYQTGMTGGYPTAWTQYSVTISGLAAPVFGRLAFRYFVEHGGEAGSRSDTIGIDTVEFAPGGIITGRCCIAATGACLVASSFTCSSLGGVYTGDGTSCQTPCPQPATGACCTVQGVCSLMTRVECLAFGGLFRGEGSACGPSAGCPFSFPFIGSSLGIPDGQATNVCGVRVYADVFVPLSFPVAAAEAAFIIDHDWQGDIKVRLIKTGGPSATMVDRPGWPAATYGFSADHFGGVSPGPQRYFRVSEAANDVYDQPAVAPPGIDSPAGAWKPETTGEAFLGTSSSGWWRLELSDCAGGNTGNLQRFTLVLTPQQGAWTCYANCDLSAVAPVLTANDFQCFVNFFAAGDERANCDGSQGSPRLTANDFICFVDRFALGCS